MSASESQQWYIEEIPAIEQDEESSYVECDRPVSVESEAAGTAPEAFISLDTGTATMLDIPQSKVEVMGGNAPSNGSDTTAHAPFIGAPEPVGGTWACKTIAASSSTQPPPPRGGCSWTKVGSKYLLFGGADAYQQHFTDTHCFDTSSGKWKKINVSGTPPSPRSGHSAIALGESLVVYGGMNGQDGVTFNDIFELRPGSEECMEWSSLPCADIPPRNSHAAVLDGETMIVIGGASPEGQTGEVFTIDLSNRSSLVCRRVSCHAFEPGAGGAHHVDSNSGVPVAREMHSACVYDSKGTEEASSITILLMGGRSATGVLRDLFSLDTDSWSWKRLQDAPVSRCAHSACFVKNAGVMAIFGGWDGGTTVANDLHIFDVRCGEWTTPNLSPRPVGRFAHAACAIVEAKSLLVFGGVNPGEDLDDVLVLSTA